MPIETFIDQVELLRRDADRVAIFGTSFGAEAALVTASLHSIDATVAVAPSSVVWAGVVGAGTSEGTWSSHWTHRGTPMPYVSFTPSWVPSTDLPEYRTLYESSVDRDPSAAAAAIRAEDIDGVVVLVAGGDDRVWPSTRFARELVERRTAKGLETTTITHPGAGHRLLLPGESAVTAGATMARGGSPAADAELGVLAWPHIVTALHLRA